MIKSKKLVLLLLFIPSLALMALTFYKWRLLNSGRVIELPISGYDPRDLLAGHYVVYQVNYGFEVRCDYEKLHMKKARKEAYVCLDSKQIIYDSPESSCQLFIKGECDYSRFKAGIERFYIPQEKAAELDRIVRKNHSKIKLSVLSDGTAMVKDIIFME